MAVALGAGLLAQQPASAPALEKGPTLSGFAPARRAAHLDLEKRFDAELKAENLRAWMHRLAARPHHLGSPYGKDNAEFIAGLFRSWGYDVAITDYQVLFPTPLLRMVELVAPTKFVASLSEPPLREDATSNQTAEALPPYNVYSPDGDVTAELVYVNYGVPADYDELERRGIDVKGKIVIARYGGSWRGIKPKVAAEHGAVGCLIYSDPRDDGFFQGDVYPNGGWRSDRAAQRGSVVDMPMYPGDPLTPGVGATKDAKRPPFKEAATLMKIPVLPISYADAQPLLKALGGPVAPAAWRGALPLTYHLGPGPARVHLKLQFDWKLATAYNVIATLKGSELPDQWVVRGNHHDAWVNGATDPVSGMVAVMEEARAIGVLAKAGWKPKRTIVFAGWDGEEPGLLGSTEWVEEHAEELGAKAVAYVNSDSNGRGFLDAGGSHSLERFVNEIARGVGADRRAARSGIACSRGAILNGSPEQRAALRDTRRSRSTRSARAPTTPRSCSTSASPRSTSASAARATTGSTTRSTTRSSTSSASWIPTTPTAWRWPRSAAARCCASPTPTCCRSSSRARPAASGPTSPTSRRWPTRCAPRRPSTTGGSTTACSRWRPTRPRRWRRRSAGRRCRRSTSRR